MSDYNWPPFTDADHAAIAASEVHRRDGRSTAEVERDDALEVVAEERAWERRHGGVSGAEADRRADVYYGGAA